MSIRTRVLSPSWSTTAVRAAAGLILATVAGACADTQPTTAPSSAPNAPVAALPAASASTIPSLFGDYDSASSDHFTHIRTQVADYRIGYLAASARSAEYTWSAQHFDRVILDWGDTYSMAQYRSLNPTGEVYRYSLDWTVIQPTSSSAPNIAATYYPDMQTWYAAHPQYDIETAFLHTAGCGKTLACRVSFKIWTDNRWAVNPGDAGLHAYQRQRMATLAADANGLFVDEHGSGDFDALPKGSLLEYPTYTAYQSDIVALLADERSALGNGKQLLINNSTYITSWDADMIRAAGASEGEYFDNPFFAEMESRWTFAESAISAGVSLDFGVGGDTPASYTAGNYASTDDRRHMWELASYYLVAPTTPGLLYYDDNGSTWSQPFSATWQAALEANIGTPTGARRIQAEGTDNSGQHYRIWARDYASALVLVRPIISWSPQTYGDETGVDVTLPTDSDYRLLHTDGTLGPVITTVTLRASEAAVLVKSAHAAVTPPPVITAPMGPTPILLVIDKDALAVNGAPNYFTRTDINADIATIGQRAQLRYFAANVGKSISLYTGKMGGYEGVYAPRTVPASWASAGPTTDGLQNYFRGGPGLGSPDASGARETLLTSVASAVPLRAAGLDMLRGQTVCAVFVQTNAWVTSFAPIAVAFQGPNLGVGAFRVDAVTAYSSSTTAKQLPTLTVTILDAASTCGGALAPLANAPAPVNPNLPFDVVP